MRDPSRSYTLSRRALLALFLSRTVSHDGVTEILLTNTFLQKYFGVKRVHFDRADELATFLSGYFHEAYPCKAHSGGRAIRFYAGTEGVTKYKSIWSLPNMSKLSELLE